MKFYLYYLLSVIILTGMITENAQAQNVPKFPSARKEIVEELSKIPENPLGQTKSLNPKSIPEAVVNDSPRVGALIQFDYDSDTIKSESYPLLKEFGLVFQQDLPDAFLLIEGHADSTGADEYNLNLSQRRADAVKRFLVSEFQIDINRLITKPYGESRPIASNETEDGQALNRRVEFVRVK